MTTPSFEQLLALVGSAEKRKLTPEEAAVLRAGMHATRRTIGGLQNRIRTLKTTGGQP